MRSTDSESVDSVLDAGAVGLRHFEVFLPRYREWTGHEPAGGDYFALAARYDQQRGIDLESLRSFATALGEELEGRLGDQAAAQSTHFGELPSHWNGSPAADNARQFLADAGTRITTSLDTLRAVHTATTTAITQIDDAVRHKADTTKNEFVADTTAGKTSQQIDWLIDLARGRGDTSQSVQDRLRTELPEHYSDGADPETVCRTWLDQVFITEIDAEVARFTTLCADTHTAVSGAYETLLTAVDSVDPTALISPGGVPAASTALASAGDQPSYVAAVGSPQVATDPDNETTPPTGQNPARTPPVTTAATQETPSSLALTATPSAADISETTDLGLGSGTEDPTGTDDSSATADESGLGMDDSSLDLGDSDLGMDDSATTPPATTGTSGTWTPADITAMVTAIGTITGNIPDMITAVSDLAGNLDEIITATGEATAAVIDATDNQPSAPGLDTDDTGVPEEETGSVEDSSSAGAEDDSSGDAPSDGTDAGQGDDDMTLEEYLNSEAGSSTGPEDTQESEDTQTAAAAPYTGTPISAPTHPASAGATTATVTTSYGSLNGIITTAPARPAKDDHHPQQVLSAASSHGNQP